MSLQPIEMKSKRIATIGSGTHLVMIADMLYHKNAAKELIKIDEFPVMVVIFKTSDSKTHEQHYVIDGAFRQDQFKKMLAIAAVQPTGENGKYLKKDAVGKRLWVSIKEIHHLNDGEVILDEEKPVIEYHIFKMSPYIDGGKPVKLAGDPVHNDGVAKDAFLDYKNFTKKKPVKKKEVIKEPEPAKPVAPDEVSMDDTPVF